MWAIPDREFGLFDGLVDLDCIELGCGTGYVSAWLLRAGARCVVGLDNSPAQLATAAAVRDERGVRLPLVHADAEQVPLRSGSFDLAISEYGAAIWCDPYRWIPEAARLLRPGGRLIFLANSVLLMLCVNDYETEPTTATLQRPQRDMHRFDWPDDDGIEFHVGHGEMLGILRSAGFEVEALHELYRTPGATTSYPWADPEWCDRWPSEELWVARRK